jgi:hypothetical protein
MSALVGAIKSQAGAAMTTSVRQQRLRSRLTTAGVCFGAFLLIYANSFYTRDWRTVVPRPEHATAEHRPVRSKVAAPVVETRLTEAPVHREPEVTGTLPKVAEPVAAPVKAETITPPIAEAPRAVAAPSHSKAQTPASAQAQTQLAPARPRVQQKASKPTQVAAAPAETAPTPAASPSAASSTPIQFQLAERGN